LQIGGCSNTRTQQALSTFNFRSLEGATDTQQNHGNDGHLRHPASTPVTAAAAANRLPRQPYCDVTAEQVQ